MALGKSAKTNCVHSTGYREQIPGGTNEIPGHTPVDDVAGLVIGEGDVDRTGGMSPVELELLQIEVRLKKYAAGGCTVIIVTDAGCQDNLVPQPGTEYGEVGYSSTQPCSTR